MFINKNDFVQHSFMITKTIKRMFEEIFIHFTKINTMPLYIFRIRCSNVINKYFTSLSFESDKTYNYEQQKWNRQTISNKATFPNQGNGMISQNEMLSIGNEICAKKIVMCSALTTEGVKHVFDEAIRACLYKSYRPKKKGLSVPSISMPSISMPKISMPRLQIQSQNELDLTMSKQMIKYDGIKEFSNKLKQWKSSRKLIDNIFADLENMFYLLSELVVQFDYISIKQYKVH
eukprot:401961_1